MRTILSGLAFVALIAGTADAQPGGGNGKGKNGGGNPQAERGMQRENRQADRRAERQAERAERQSERRFERQAERRPERQVERRAERQAERMDRQAERQAERVDRQAERRTERQAERVDRKVEQRAERAERKAERQTERRIERLDRNVERDQRRAERALLRDERRDDLRRFADGDAPRFSGRGRGLIEGCPPGLAKKNNGCRPPGLAKQDGLGRNLTAAAGAGLLGGTLSPSWFGYDDYGPDYRYYDGYLLRTRGDDVLGYVPLLGGALAPGQPWLSYYEPRPIPAYWTDYYGLGSRDRYRYYDDVIFELGPGYSEIDQIVAILAGDPWAVGRPMPYGYDVYNVPYSYRARYYDTSDHWYRYADGYVYDIDPTTRLVRAIVQLLGGGALTPGQPWLASYRPAPIPDYWTDYYGLSSVDRYRYYDDAIYGLDPGYSEVEEVVAVMTGDPWAVGRPMPYGYDVYNVPYSYRTRYYDRPDHWYRYADGYIYDIDPATRMVLAAVQLLT